MHRTLELAAQRQTSRMRNAEVIRQWQILQEIESRRTGVTIHELSKLVKVTTRTIRRDLQALQESGFAIYDEGGEHETKRWRLEVQPFRAVPGRADGRRRRGALPEPLDRGRPVGLAALRVRLRAAFDKIEKSLNPRMREFRRRCRQVISAKAAPGSTTNRIVDATRRLLDATRERREVEMVFLRQQPRQDLSRPAIPPVARTRQRVLVAWVPAYDAFRTFAVERVERLSVTDETFRHTRQLPDDPFGSSMGVFTGRPGDGGGRVRRAHGAGRPWTHVALVAARRGSARRRGAPHDGRLDRPGAEELDLGFGASIRVLRPASLASAVPTSSNRRSSISASDVPTSGGRPISILSRVALVRQSAAACGCDRS